MRRHAVALGLLAGVAYGAVETWLSSVGPRFFYQLSSYLPTHPLTSLVLLLFYAVVGGIVGQIAGEVASRRYEDEAKRRRLVNYIISGVLTLTIAIHAILAMRGLSATALTALAVVLLLMVAYACRSNRFTVETHFLVHPVTFSLLLLFPIFVVKELMPFQSLWIKVGALGAVTGAIGLVAVILARWFHGTRASIGRRLYLIVVGLLCLGPLISFVPPSQPKLDVEVRSPARRAGPDVILIVLDTVRADHLSVYGYPRDTSPNLREFAKTATLFSMPIAPSNNTISTHASIFTGLYASAHGAHFDGIEGWSAAPLGERYETLAEVLKDRGYHTALVAANFGYFGPEYGLTQGFDWVDVRPALSFWASPPRHFLRHSVQRLLRPFLRAPDADVVSRRAEAINEQVLQFLKAVEPSDASFFLFANYMDAHMPYVPPRSFAHLYWTGSFSPTIPELDEEIWERQIASDHSVSDEERAYLISQYDGAIAYLDSELGRLFDELKARGMYEDSMIIITSDHGEAFGARGFYGHGSSAYQDQVFVPLLIKYPGQDESIRVEPPVSLVDLFPTILAEAGAKRLSEGVVLTNPHEERPEVFAESFPLNAEVDTQIRLWRGRAVVHGRTKLLTPVDGEFEVYDLQEDPNETMNLFSTTMHGDLLHSLKQWSDVRPSPEATSDLDLEDAKRRLRALGYLR